MNKPILLTRGIVVFPSTETIVEVGRTKSINAINLANEGDKKILITSQRDAQIEEPKFSDIYNVGTLCEIIKIENADDGSSKVTIRGLKRVRISTLNIKNNAYNSDYEVLKEINTDARKNNDGIQLLYTMMQKTINELSEKESKALKALFLTAPSASKITDQIAMVIASNVTVKQGLLEELDVAKRITIILGLSANNDDRKKVDNEINKQVNDTLQKQQKEFYLREKMRVVKEQLGEINSKENDNNSFKKRLEENPYPEHVKKRVLAELNHMESANPQENSITRTYIEWLLDIPWWQMTTDNNDVNHVEEVLNKSHYGLEKVKERIVEYLAVRARSPQSKAPIICLVGPPGVGKSTLALSIAEALNKKFVKMSLGGVRDEAEIRGHRKTYLGSMPGRIIKAMKQAGVINPLFLLDELDKMTSDMRGDPASAMLEVLDPEQNNKFSDNYIEEYYDLSKVMFVATANYADQIPAALYDRLEIIELTSYTEREKLEIAKKYLVPRVRKDAAISDKELSFTDDALLHIIRRYTQEAGVRQLERLIQKIARKFIVKQQHKEIQSLKVDVKDIVTYLKKEVYDYNTNEPNPIPGVVNGMAYTSAGGDLLPIEVTYFKGKGIINITGNLKETMKESAQVALGYVRTNAVKFGIKDIDFNKIDIHIHVPSGGIPKDGPSAGVTLVTAIISALTNRSVPNTISMTGEIMLRGRVGIIGGVKEKVISAFRGGVNEIFLPSKDERFLEDVPQEVSSRIKFHLIDHYDQIYKTVFKH